MQYEVSQQPRLLAHLSVPLIDLLQLALDSHRTALRIDQDNPDLLLYASLIPRGRRCVLINLSNTAQVLTSLAETLNDSKSSPELDRNDTLRLLQEALELFQRCLNVQEFKLDEAQEPTAHDHSGNLQTDDPGSDRVSGNASDASEEEVWASVEESITKGTLLDTTLVQLNTLTTICTLGSTPNQNDLAWVEEYYRTTLLEKINAYSSSGTSQHEIAIAKAKFISAISDAAFRSRRLDAATYERELNAAFNDPNLDLNQDIQGLCDKADAYLTFQASIQSSLPRAQPCEIGQIDAVCWKHVTKALDSLTAASKIPDAQNLPRIHLKRGDCELMRFELGQKPLGYDLAVKSASTLVKNAEVYYRGAVALAKSNEAAKEEMREAEVKEAVAAAVGGDECRLQEMSKLRREAVEIVLGDMIDEGILSSESVRKIAKSLT